MRIALALVSLFAISCSTSNKYIFLCGSECSPSADALHDSGGWGSLNSSEDWEDANDDGLRDVRVSASDRNPVQVDEAAIALFTARDEFAQVDTDVELVLVDVEGRGERERIVRDVTAVVERAHAASRSESEHDEQLERALKQLERALEEVRRALR